jgi:hypothetical protein
MTDRLISFFTQGSNVVSKEAVLLPGMDCVGTMTCVGRAVIRDDSPTLCATKVFSNTRRAPGSVIRTASPNGQDISRSTEQPNTASQTRTPTESLSETRLDGAEVFKEPPTRSSIDDCCRITGCSQLSANFVLFAGNRLRRMEGT